MKNKEMYMVRTTHIGADSPSETYYKTRKKAEKYLSTCENGEIEAVIVSNTKNAFDGCTYDDLCGPCGDNVEVKIRKLDDIQVIKVDNENLGIWWKCNQEVKGAKPDPMIVPVEDYEAVLKLAKGFALVTDEAKKMIDAYKASNEQTE